VIYDVPKEKVPDLNADIGTSVQETNAPIQVNESEPEKEEIVEAKKHQMSYVLVIFGYQSINWL